MSRPSAANTNSLRIGRRAAVVGTLSLACSAPTARAPSGPPPPPKRYSGKLEDYVPAAGLRWLVRGSPAKLAESQSFRPALAELLSGERLGAVARTTGFALETLNHGLIAGFDLGTLYLAELPSTTAAQARARFSARQIHDISTRNPDPGIYVLSGLNEGVPIGLVTIDEQVLAYGVGDPLLCRVVEAYARGRLKAKKAFEGAALRGLDVETADALVAAYVPGPFDERWQSAAAGLLGITTAVSAKLTATQPGRAALEVSLHGDFADSDAPERLRSTYMSVASSSTGTLLGLDAALDARTLLSPKNDVVSLQVPLPITDIARHTHAVTSGDLGEILRLSPGSSGIATPTSAPESR
ncbi:MAG TPA: hypothetical protein VHB79_22705 [Polyangiaceae bacterium]|nr:hypothetical protein [Polyangiaceae bacterium]